MKRCEEQWLTSGGQPAARCAARGGALFLGILFMLNAILTPAVGQSPVQDAFNEVDGGSAASGPLMAEEPFADDPQSPAASSNETWQSKQTQTGSQLKWGNGTQVLQPAPSAEVLPPPKIEGRVPLVGLDVGDDFEMSQNEQGLIKLIVRDKPLSHVLAALAQAHGLNIVASNDIDALISITLRDVPLDQALTAILSVANYTWVQRGDIILITSLTGATNLPADVQGRQIQVFHLDFVSASTVADAITGFLSPIGKVTISESSSEDNRLTRELVVVEDLPDSLDRIAVYIAQVDCPPRQVLIEAHILQVNLDDTNRHGINLNQLLRLHHASLRLNTTGFANPAAPQAFLATLEGGDLGSVIELLQTTSDAKSLGSPKLLVLNEQEAKFQVGEKLGYRTTTTTETSSLQSVQFLEVGVVLTVTPRITRDGRVLMHVAPKVSTGDVVNEIPNEQTTELYSDVILEDGQGMIIGGLIKEADSVSQSKVPYLGDVKGLGWFFRRTEVTKERVEIIVALVPRIQPYDPCWQAFEQGELVKAGVPLLHGPLHRTHRPWDAVLPDGERVHKPLIPWRARHGRAYPRPGMGYVVPPHPLPQQHFYGEACMPAPHLPNGRRPFLSDEAIPAPELDHRSSLPSGVMRTRD